MKRLLLSLLLLFSIALLACPDHTCSTCGAGYTHGGTCPNANAFCSICGARTHNPSGTCSNEKSCYIHGDYHGDSCPSTETCDQGHSHPCGSLIYSSKEEIEDIFTNYYGIITRLYNMIVGYSNCPDITGVTIKHVSTPILPYCLICQSTITQDTFELFYNTGNGSLYKYEFGEVTKIKKGSIIFKGIINKKFGDTSPAFVYEPDMMLPLFSTLEKKADSPSGYAITHHDFFVSGIEDITIVPYDFDLYGLENNLFELKNINNFSPLFFPLDYYNLENSNYRKTEFYEDILKVLYAHYHCTNNTTCVVCKRHYHSPNGCPNTNNTCFKCGKSIHNESLSCQNQTCSEYADSVQCSICGAYYVGTCYNSDLRCKTCGVSIHNQNKTCPYEDATCLDCGESIHNSLHFCQYADDVCETCEYPLIHDSSHACPNEGSKCSMCGEDNHRKKLACLNKNCTAYSFNIADHLPSDHYIITNNSPLFFNIRSKYSADTHDITLEYSIDSDLASAIFESVITVDNFQSLNGRSAYHFGLSPLKNISVPDDTVITVRARITEKDGFGEVYTEPQFYVFKNRKGLK